MKRSFGYGQFCPAALASEVLAERWTPLVVRELLMGSRRFREIHRGVPRMSPTLLTDRLRKLERCRVVERRRGRSGEAEYRLTRAGTALEPVLWALSRWGRAYASSRIERRDVDPALLMWEIRRWTVVRELPRRRVVVLFLLTDAPKGYRSWWLVSERGRAELCLTSPPQEPDLSVVTDRVTLACAWRGDVGIPAAVRTGRIRLAGSPELARSFSRWIGVSPYASVRARP